MIIQGFVLEMWTGLKAALEMRRPQAFTIVVSTIFSI